MYDGSRASFGGQKEKLKNRKKFEYMNSLNCNLSPLLVHIPDGITGI